MFRLFKINYKSFTPTEKILISQRNFLTGKYKPQLLFLGINDVVGTN